MALVLVVLSGATTPTSIDFTKTFEVVVGCDDAKKSFMLHNDIFEDRSGFFEAARSERWTEPTKATELPHDDPATFTAYIQCVYTNEVVAEESNTSTDSFEFFSKLYALADMLRDVATANLVMDSFMQHSDAMDCVVNISSISLIYGLTVSGSQLRKLVVDHYISEMNVELAIDDIDDESLPHNFLRDLAKGLFASQTVSKRGICHYHQQDDEHPKCV